MSDLTLSRTHTRLDDLVVLTKIRLNALVVATTAGGYYMAAPASIDLASLAITCLGTALVASGASAINQVRRAGHGSPDEPYADAARGRRPHGRR